MGLWGQSKPAKSGGLFGGKPAKPTGKCPDCRKVSKACKCWKKDGAREKAKVKVQGRDGRTRTVTKNTGNIVRGANTWCGTCSCLVRNGQCVNARCSTRSA